MKIVSLFVLSAVFLYYPLQQLKAQNVGVNTTTPEAALDINGDIIIRPAELTVNDGITLALDVNTIRFSYYRVTGPVADFTIAGITAGIDGRLVTLFNRSGFAMQLNNEDVNVTATDMIVTGTGLDITIPNKGIVNLQYDGIEQKWIVKSSSKGGVAAAGGFWDANGNDIHNINIGNVGIGINSPLAPLHIKNNNEALRVQGSTPFLSFYDNAGTTLKGFVQQYNDNFYLGTPAVNTDGIMQFYVKNAPVMTMLPTGLVGIGTATPADKLTVNTSGFGLTHTNGTATLGTWIGNFQGVTSAMIGTKSNHALHFFTANGPSQMTLSTAGNFGIGTTAPVEKLTVQTPNGNFGISHRSNEGNILASFIGGTSAGIGTFSNTNMRIFSNGASAIFIGAGTNNVGIGIDFPTNKLEVNGTIRSKEVVVDNISWPDYVFGKNHKLPLLSDIEKFIQQNKHLPGIPSAKEIQEKGLPIGDVQKKMMEKIEELTLYLIEANKKIERLEKLIGTK